MRANRRLNASCVFVLNFYVFARLCLCLARPVPLFGFARAYVCLRLWLCVAPPVRLFGLACVSVLASPGWG